VTTIIKTMDAPALDRWRVKVQQEADIKVAYGLLSSESHFANEDYFREWFLHESGEQYEADRQSDEARDLGKEVHALIEAHLKAKLRIAMKTPIVSDQAHSLFASFETWERDAGLVPLAVESLVASWQHNYAGTVDLFALVEGKLTVLDWKSKKAAGKSKLWDEQVLQNVAYRRAAEENGLGACAGLIVRIPKDGGSIEPVPVTDDAEEAFRAFLGLKAALEWSRKREKA
jgi:hypothetical protein